jgi:uncharacterized protein DUF4180
MNLHLTEENNIKQAELQEEGIVINEIQDAIDLLGNAFYNGVTKIIVKKEHLNPTFFDLKTGFAGDVLQKFSNYSMQLVIRGNFEKYTSKSLKDFIYESNKSGRIQFLNSN